MVAPSTPPAVKPRTWICLDCRTLLSFDEPCDLGHRRRACLPTRDGQQALFHVTWRMTEPNWRDDDLFDFKMISPFGHGPRPLGVKPPDLPRSRERVTGRVETTTPTYAPASARTCAAWQLALCSKHHTGGPILVLDGETAGFRVVPQTGDPVLVRAGRIRLAATPTVVDLKRPDLFSLWLRWISVDPLRPVTPLPYDQLRETILVDGDHVEIDGPFESLAVGESPGYREIPTTVLTPAGVPRIRPL